MRSIAVYCGSSTPPDPRYIELARSVGTELAKRGIKVVYGGGRLGLMGAIADSAMAAGGYVVGVIPQALEDREVAHHGCNELHIVSGMHERKLIFTQLSDGFLTLPGGVGTMEELWEAVSWAQLGYHAKPVGLLNAFGFFDGLLAFNAHMVETGFIRPAHAELMLTEATLDPLLERMTNYEPIETIFDMRTFDL